MSDSSRQRNSDGPTRRQFVVATGGLLLGGSLFGACGGDNGAGAGGAADGSGTVGFAMSTFTVPRYKNVDLPAFREAVENSGLKLVSNQANDDPEVQARNVENLLTGDIGALAIIPVVGEAAVSMVRRAKQDGVPVLAYNTAIPSGDIAGLVSRNNIEVGEDKARAAERFTPLTGNWVIVSGEAGNAVADQVTEGYFNVLQPRIDEDELEIVSHEFHKAWDPELARRQAQQALTRTSGDIQGFLCNNDGMALGVLSALGDRAGDIFVCGLDATEEGCRAIVEGRMAFSSFTRFDEMGTQGGELCARLARGEDISSDQVYDTGDGEVPLFAVESYNVTRGNLVDYLERYSPSYVNAEAVFRGVPKSQWPEGASQLLAAA